MTTLLPALKSGVGVFHEAMPAPRASDWRRFGDALVHPLAVSQMADPPAQEGEVQRRDAELSEQERPDIHHHRRADTNQQGPHHELEFFVHGKDGDARARGDPIVVLEVRPQEV
ncbi:MAG: hypothetical protein Q8N23_32210 [Archangium sp.]|nr:hypothetical protein [Archangium sp.]MDP3571215.1 hypothetical protein [Archangium sp.]